MEYTNFLIGGIFGRIFAQNVKYFYIDRSCDMELDKSAVSQKIESIKLKFRNELNDLIHLQANNKNNNLDIFVNSLLELEKCLLKYESDQRKFIYENGEKDTDLSDVINGYAMLVMECTTDLMIGLKSTNFDISKGTKEITTYVARTKLHEHNSRAKNILKAISTVAMGAAYSLIGLLVGPIVGLISAPLVGAMKSDGSMSGVTVGVIGGTIFSPLIAFFTTLSYAKEFASLGYRSGKEWLGVPKHESVNRHGFFKPSPLINAISSVEESTKGLLQSFPKKLQKCSI